MTAATADLPEHPAGQRDLDFVPLGTQIERWSELCNRDANAEARSELIERGTYDPDRHGTAPHPPLTRAEHIELLALGESIARSVRHPSIVDRAVRSGVTWQQVAQAIDRDEIEVRRAYREWADGQRDLYQRYGEIGMSETEYTAAAARAAQDRP